MRLYNWLETAFDDGGRVYLKRLAGNDTLLTESHQAGPYIPKKIIFELFPSVGNSDAKNPDAFLTAHILSHSWPEVDVRVIWYNGKVIGEGTRNECRITGWGGRASPMLDPESTGSLAVLSFKGQKRKDASYCEVWVCSSVEEEDVLEDRFGPVEPGAWLYVREPSGMFKIPRPPEEAKVVQETAGQYIAFETDPAQLSFVLGRPVDRNCRLTPDQIPQEWLISFPSGEEIIEKSASMRPAYVRLASDNRLLKRRHCEYELFLSVEEAVVLPEIQKGFTSVDAFVSFANSVTNRRKARSGRSLELHAKRIFEEERVPSFSHDQVSEGRKRPDFLFPSADSYHDANFPAEKLRMLAAKTCCKDRWRQVADEAERIETKHLLTLQEGVSKNQFAQMQKAGITLVVPQPLFTKYPEALRGKLVSLEAFIGEVKGLTST